MKSNVTFVPPSKIEVEIHKEGDYYIYNYIEHSKRLSEKDHGNDDTQNFFDEGNIIVPGCEVIKFESTPETTQCILKTKNPLKFVAHLIHEISILGSDPWVEEVDNEKVQ